MLRGGAVSDPRHAADRAAAERLSRLAGWLAVHGGVRYVDYRDAERLTEKLAARLRDELPPGELAGCRFAGVPRGGLLVLGLLAYALDLSAAQLAAGEDDPRRPLVLVDDCALSGTRLRAELARRRTEEIVVAHLLSAAELRAAVAAAEPRVRACVGGDDLADRSAAIVPDDEERRAWRRRWQERLGGRPYWFGAVEPVAFAWGQPDVVWWDPAGEEVQAGWHLVPPEASFKRRMQLAGPLVAARPRRWRVSPAVIHAEEGERLWLFDAERGVAFSLTGPGADIWRLLAATGDPELAAERLAEVYAASPGDLRRDVEELVGELSARGLLRRAEPAAQGR